MKTLIADGIAVRFAKHPKKDLWRIEIVTVAADKTLEVRAIGAETTDHAALEEDYYALATMINKVAGTGAAPIHIYHKADESNDKKGDAS